LGFKKAIKKIGHAKTKGTETWHMAPSDGEKQRRCLHRRLPPGVTDESKRREKEEEKLRAREGGGGCRRRLGELCRVGQNLVPDSGDRKEHMWAK